jgi:hypothetical protein
MRVLLLFYVIACTADAAYPQSRIPGPSFDASRLHAAVDTFVSVSVNAGRSDTIGWATQSLRRADFGGRDSWVQVYRWHGRDGVQSSDSLVVDAHSLLPLSEARSTPAGSVLVTYDGARVRARITTRGGAARLSDTTYAAPVYSSASLELLGRAIVARHLASATIDLYYPFPAPYGVHQAVLKASATESLHLPTKGSVECQVVEASLIGSITRLWIGKASGEIVQLASGEGTAVVWFRHADAASD